MLEYNAKVDTYQDTTSIRWLTRLREKTHTPLFSKKFGFFLYGPKIGLVSVLPIKFRRVRRGRAASPVLPECEHHNILKKRHGVPTYNCEPTKNTRAIPYICPALFQLQNYVSFRDFLVQGPLGLLNVEIKTWNMGLLGMLNVWGVFSRCCGPSSYSCNFKG